MTESDSRENWNILCVARAFPRCKRALWVKMACQNAGNNDDRIANAVNDALLRSEHVRRYAASLDEIADILSVECDLEAFKEAAIRLHHCAREARWIRFSLNKKSAAGIWQDALMDALSIREVVEMARENAALAAWVAQAPSSEEPPDILDVVPPLEFEVLRRIRLVVDKITTRHARELSRRTNAFELTLGTEPFTDRGSQQETHVLEAVQNLDKLSQAAVYLYFFDGETYASIARKLRISSTASAYRVVQSALSTLKDALVDDGILEE
jgi:DNA-directed RNA polymerase specialized sigma24 family protein